MLGSSGYFDWDLVISESPPMNIQCMDSVDSQSSISDLKEATFSTSVSLSLLICSPSSLIVLRLMNREIILGATVY